MTGMLRGGVYRDYFTHKRSYAVTNVPRAGKGFGSISGGDVKEIPLDLEGVPPKQLEGKFDVVLNICTLEHVRDIETAFSNLCRMSRDAVILVVPAIQQIHVSDYGDYWRMTTLGVAKMFQKHGYVPLVIRANDQPFRPIFVFAIAVRDLKKYEGKLPPSLDLEMGAALYGSSLKKRYIPDLLRN